MNTKELDELKFLSFRVFWQEEKKRSLTAPEKTLAENLQESF